MATDSLVWSSLEKESNVSVIGGRIFYELACLKCKLSMGSNAYSFWFLVFLDAMLQGAALLFGGLDFFLLTTCGVIYSFSRLLES